MTRWALHEVRHGLYAPLEVLADLGICAPPWLVALVVAMDRPLLRALAADWGDGGSAPM